MIIDLNDVMLLFVFYEIMEFLTIIEKIQIGDSWKHRLNQKSA